MIVLFAAISNAQPCARRLPSAVISTGSSPAICRYRLCSPCAFARSSAVMSPGSHAAVLPVHMLSVRFTRAAFQRAHRSPVGGGIAEPAAPPAPADVIVIPPAPPPAAPGEPRPAVVPAIPLLP